MYKVKKPIPGFENVMEAELHEINEHFAILKLKEIIFTLINPFSLDKNYSFEIPADAKALLEIDENNPVLVYCNLVKKEPFEESIVNFKAPILINPKNKTLAQIICNEHKYRKIGDFVK